MPDRLSPEARSAHMRKIRKRDTKPELAVRRIAHRLGYRFRLNRRDLPGTPDLVFPSRRKVVFVHGCFWHQHEGCRLARLPKSRLEYWLPKLERNVARDAETYAKLRSTGWEPLVLWECETTNDKLIGDALDRYLSTHQPEMQAMGTEEPTSLSRSTN